MKKQSLLSDSPSCRMVGITKTLLGLTTMSFLLVSNTLQAQTDDDSYRRSSLYTFFIDSEKDAALVDKEGENENAYIELVGSFVNTEREKTAEDSIPKSELILQLFSSVEIPAQFNDHNLDQRIMDYDRMVLLTTPKTTAAAAPAAKSKSNFGGMMKGLGRSTLSVVSAGAVSETPDNMKDSIPMAIENFFATENIPAKVVAKWYNYTGEQYEHPFTKEPVYYNVGLIEERGWYNASGVEREMSQFNARGEAEIRNAGRELIPNTFVMGLRLKYMNNKDLVAQATSTARGIGAVAGSFLGVDAQSVAVLTEAAGAVAGAAMGDGYSVQATSYLYQLVWNEEVEMNFGQYIDQPIDALIEAGICKLQLIGEDKSSAGIRSRKFSKKPESELIKRAMVRSIDAVIARLQSNYDVFKTKCKIARIDDEGIIHAEIGLKEGISKNDEYEVLERIVDKETKEITFKKVGSVKPIDGQIWDNRYEAEEEISEDKEAGVETTTVSMLKATAFKGRVKDAHPGMYLRLEKKSKK